jgi:DNA-binding MarR family transcriptional regulator
MPKPTMTANLKRLEAAGFVRREIDPADLRRHRLMLTASGRRAMLRGVAVISEAFGARLARLSAAEQRDLEMLLDKLS